MYFNNSFFYSILFYLYLKKYYISNLYINNYKFNYFNLINLENIMYKIYNKKIILKIIKIKYLYLDNNIFITSLLLKLNNRKKKALKIIKKGLRLVKIAKLYINKIEKFNILEKNYI